MAFKQFALDERTTVTIYKRRRSRSLRLTIAADGNIRVSIPTWTPYRAGFQFAQSKREWIASQARPKNQLVDGQPIGKAHRLRFIESDSPKLSSRVVLGEVRVFHPVGSQPYHPEVQNTANQASRRALRQQAEKLLPQRLAALAKQHGFSYGNVTVKQLKSRWGSCDQSGNIVLNLFLMQLPWECIDYVLLHELTHTRIMRHGPVFWTALEGVLPDAKRLRKLVREFQPVLT